MTPLDPLFALVGGLVIGLAAALFLLLSGRIAGVSGLVARAVGLSDNGPTRVQALAFVVGLPAGAWLVGALVRTPQIVVPSSIPLLVAGGFLVGFGTRMGGGCTSGHGVCGISRLSPRSLVATAAFMVAGFATVGVVRHLVGG